MRDSTTKSRASRSRYHERIASKLNSVVVRKGIGGCLIEALAKDQRSAFLNAFADRLERDRRQV